MTGSAPRDGHGVGMFSLILASFLIVYSREASPALIFFGTMGAFGWRATLKY
jgi:hypothetical protein